MATTDSTLANRRDYDEIVANLLPAEVAEAVEKPANPVTPRREAIAVWVTLMSASCW